MGLDLAAFDEALQRRDGEAAAGHEDQVWAELLQAGFCGWVVTLAEEHQGVEQPTTAEAVPAVIVVGVLGPEPIPTAVVPIVHLATPLTILLADIAMHLDEPAGRQPGLQVQVIHVLRQHCLDKATPHKRGDGLVGVGGRDGQWVEGGRVSRLVVLPGA